MTKTINSIFNNRIYELQMEYDSRDDSEDECYAGEILARMDECNKIQDEIRNLTNTPHEVKEN